MSNSIPVEGAVIKCFPYRESDLIVRFVAKDFGKLSALARGARKSKKRFIGGLDIFDQGSFSISVGKGSLLTLNSFTPQVNYAELRTNLDRFSLATLVCECFDLLLIDNGNQLERIPNHIGIFEAFSGTLAKLSSAESTFISLGDTFDAIAKLLELNGHLDVSDLSRSIPRSMRGLQLLIDRIEELTQRSVASRLLIDEAFISRVSPPPGI